MSTQRIQNSIKADIKFQLKQGFYAVYVVLSVIYIIVLSFIPPDAKRYVLPILIYTDPAALGMFFIGGMVLLEKEQGILALLYITPLRVYEYIASKILTLGVISALVAAAISLTSPDVICNYFLLLSGTFLSSVFYTLVGFLIASQAKSVNAYLVKMIPSMFVVVLPCLTLIGNDIIPSFVNLLMLLVPSAGGLKLILGAYNDISALEIIISLAGLIVVNSLLVKKVASVLTNRVILHA